MRYLPTSKLTPGMALGQDIYDGAGRLLLAKHLLLSEEYISNLEFLGFPGIYIDDEFTQGIEIQQVLNPQVRSQALKVVHDMFAFDVASDAEEDMPVSEIKIQKTIERIVENILSNGDIMCNVLDIKNYDDYIYYHSINVAMMSVLLGANYGMNEESLYQLTTAAILHDIGKRFLDIGIINADHALTEEETQLLRKHPELGADYLKGNYHFSTLVYAGVMQHHENYDGTGYPLGKSAIDTLLAESFKELAKKHPIEKITIKEITDLAGVIRPTFYNHFQDKYELLEWIITTDLLDPIEPLIQNGMINEGLVLLFTNIEKDSEFYSRAIKLEGQNSFGEIAQSCVEKILLKVIDGVHTGKKQKYSWLTPKRIAEYYAQSMCYVVISWIQSGMTISAKELAEIYDYIIKRSMDDIIAEM